MDDPKALQLFQEVLAKTAAGRIKWEASASESEFFAVLPDGFTLLIFTFSDREDQIALALRGEEGELLRVTTEVNGVAWPELSKLYELARRQALSVDAKVDQLLGVLSKL